MKVEAPLIETPLGSLQSMWRDYKRDYVGIHRCIMRCGVYIAIILSVYIRLQVWSQVSIVL